MRFSTLKRLKRIPVILFIVFVACNNKENTTIIDKEEFVQILADLHITDAILAEKAWYDAKLKDSTRSYYNYVLKKYHISRAQFDNSLNYYSNNLEEYSLMYEEVEETIRQRIPKQLDEKSIYKIFELVKKEAEIKSDLNAYYGINGRELWRGKRAFELPKDTINILTRLTDSIQYQCLVVFKAEVKILPKNPIKDLKLELQINYADTTNDVVEKLFDKKIGKWNNYKLLLKSDSTKIPVSIVASLLKPENDSIKPKIEFKSISLKQYAPNKDTSLVDSIIPIRKIKNSKLKEMMYPD